MSKPLQIGLVMLGGRSWMGGSEYIRNIIRALASLPPEQRQTFEVSLLAHSSVDAEFAESVRPYLKAVHYLDKMVPRTFLSMAWWGIREHLLRLPDKKYNMVLDKQGLDFVYPVVSLDCGFSLDRVVSWIPDFQHKYLPGFFSQEELWTRNDANTRMTKVAPLIIVSSRSAEADMGTFYPEGMFKTKVLSFKSVPKDAWYVQDPLEVQKKYELPDKFFIVSNQFWQHKGHLTLFRAMGQLKQEGLSPVVVCTGEFNDPRQPEYAAVMKNAIAKLGIEGQLRLVGLIPKSDQIQLLRRSIALIQPSLFEGWSTIVEEARCLGKHTILSDLGVHMEQNPPGCRFFDRNSPDALASAMTARWKTLAPGPDLEREQAALQTARFEVREFGETFLKIARTFAEERTRDGKSRLVVDPR